MRVPVVSELQFSGTFWWELSWSGIKILCHVVARQDLASNVTWARKRADRSDSTPISKRLVRSEVVQAAEASSKTLKSCRRGERGFSAVSYESEYSEYAKCVNSQTCFTCRTESTSPDTPCWQSLPRHS